MRTIKTTTAEMENTDTHATCASPNLPEGALIIGFGSGIRGDDAFGPRVAEVLELRVPQSVKVQTCQGLTPDLALDIAETDMVVFIDCALGEKPGEIRHEVIKALNDMSLSMVHFLSPAALMTWCETLYDKRPVGHIFSVTGESYEISDTLRPCVEEAVDVVARSVLRLLSEQGLLAKESCGA